MNETNLSYHLKLFNQKVRAMNQANSKILTLNADEARNIQADIFELLGTISDYIKKEPQQDVSTIVMDGGSFK